MGITKERAQQAVQRNGHLLRFVQTLDEATIGAWEVNEIEGTQQERDNFIADYIDEVYKEQEGPQAHAAAVAHALLPMLLQFIPRREVDVSASKCSSTKWNQQVRLLLEEAYYIDFGARMHAPCCAKLARPVPLDPALPVFAWPNPAGGEDHRDNVTALAAYLRHMAPPGVLVLPVQRLTWYSARIDCSSTSTLVINPSRTDYLWILEEARDVCNLEAVTLDDMQALMFYIVGMYEAKLPAELRPSSQNQGVLEYLGVNHVVDPVGARPFTLPVVVGDGIRHACVHDGGRRVEHGAPKRILHVAQPATARTDPQRADLQSMARIKGLLSEVAAAVRLTLAEVPAADPGGGQSGGDTRMAERGESAPQSSPSTNPSADGDGGSVDEAAQEAYALNVHAQQMMSVLKDPRVYGSLGLTAPPASYSPVTLEDLFGSCTILDPDTGLPRKRIGRAA